MVGESTLSDAADLFSVKLARNLGSMEQSRESTDLNGFVLELNVRKQAGGGYTVFLGVF